MKEDMDLDSCICTAMTDSSLVYQLSGLEGLFPL